MEPFVQNKLLYAIPMINLFWGKNVVIKRGKMFGNYKYLPM